MTTSGRNFKDSIERSVAVIAATFDERHCALLAAISDLIIAALQGRRKLLLCGNGGSAADCQHVAAEFVGRFKKERSSYPAIALTTDTSILTAVGNDYGFVDIFSRQVEGLGQAGDILIGISTSGNSPNVIRAFEVARKRGLKTVGFTGQGGGAVGRTADYTFTVESTYTPDIQAGHIMALHAVCETVENALASAERT